MKGILGIYGYFTLNGSRAASGQIHPLTAPNLGANYLCGRSQNFLVGLPRQFASEGACTYKGTIT
jgi:hypothetical protein